MKSVVYDSVLISRNYLNIIQSLPRLLNSVKTCAELEGDRGLDPPEKSQKYMVS